MRKFAGLLLVTSALLAFEVAAQAPAATVGKWAGTLQNYRDRDTPDRVFVMKENGQCHWDLGSKADNPAAQTCQISSDGTISFTTGPGSAVSLKLKGTKLEGTFQTKLGGRAVFISMTKQ